MKHKEKFSNFDKHHHKKSPVFYVLLGLMFLAAGIVVILKQTGDITPEHASMIFSWPSLIISVGLLGMLSNPRSWFFSFAVLGVGVYFWLDKFYGLPMETRTFILAAALIMIGMTFILRKVIFRPLKEKTKHRFSEQVFNEDIIDEVNVFAGSKSEVLSKNFKGGKVVNVFGGSQVDLTQAEMAEGNNILDVVCVLGGLELIIPPTWYVVDEVRGVLGAFEVKGRSSNTEIDRSRKLIIRGVAVLGGGEIRISRY